MHQQINLYQPVFRKQVKVFSATTLAQIAAVVLVMLLLVYGHARWQLAGMEQDIARLQQQEEHLRAQLDRLVAETATPDTAALDSEIGQLEADIARRQTLLARFEQLGSGHQRGFADTFRALAEQRVPGLWLEGISVDDAGRIELRGVTLDDRLVPVYLQQLEQQAALADMPFASVSLQRIDPDQPHIQFVLLNRKVVAP